MRAARVFGACLFGLGYALWLGGLVALGAVMAPNVAATLHAPAVLAGAEPLKRALLNGIVGASFRVFNDICLVCAALMIGGGALEGIHTNPRFRRATAWRNLCVLLALATVARLFVIGHAMDHAQAHGLWTSFDALHHQYETTAMLELPVLLVAGGVTALRDGFARHTTHKGR